MSGFNLFGQEIIYEEREYGKFVFHDTPLPHYERMDVQRFDTLFRKNDKVIIRHVLETIESNIEYALQRTAELGINEEQKGNLERTKTLIERVYGVLDKTHNENTIMPKPKKFG
jgi:hypothetical protein